MSIGRWIASDAVRRRPFDHEHMGVCHDEAVQRILDLIYAAKDSGITHRVYDHMVQLAPCLTMHSTSKSTVTVKLDVDTGNVDRAKGELDLVSRTDVLRMIAEAIKDCEARLPTTLRQARCDGRINACI